MTLGITPEINLEKILRLLSKRKIIRTKLLENDSVALSRNCLSWDSGADINWVFWLATGLVFSSPLLPIINPPDQHLYDDRPQLIASVATMTGGTPELRSDKSLTLMTFNIQHSNNGPTDQRINGPMDQWTNGTMDQWTNGPMVQWTNGPMDQWSHGPIVQWS